MTKKDDPPPVFNTTSLAKPSGQSDALTDQYADLLKESPTKREWRLLKESVDDYKHQARVVTDKYDNSQMLLRELYRLEKEKHYYICNVLFAALFMTIGGLILGKVIVPPPALVPEAAVMTLGWLCILVSLVLGICKPAIVEVAWKFLAKRTFVFKCPHCQTYLTDKEAAKE